MVFKAWHKNALFFFPPTNWFRYLNSSISYNYWNTRFSVFKRNHSITAQGEFADVVLELLYFIFNPFCHLRLFFFFLVFRFSLFIYLASKVGLDTNVNRHAVPNFLVYDVRLAMKLADDPSALGEFRINALFI